MPACEQSSSFPGVPETPTAPTISTPTLIGSPPASARTRVYIRKPTVSGLSCRRLCCRKCDRSARQDSVARNCQGQSAGMSDVLQPIAGLRSLLSTAAKPLHFRDGSKAPLCPPAVHFGSSPINGHCRGPSACRKSATTGREQAQQTAQLFDHLVDAHQERFGNREAEHLRGLEIDHKFKLGRVLHG